MKYTQLSSTFKEKNNFSRKSNYLLRKNWAVLLTAVISPVGTRTPIWTIAWSTCRNTGFNTSQNITGYKLSSAGYYAQRTNFVRILFINSIEYFKQSSPNILADTGSWKGWRLLSILRCKFSHGMELLCVCVWGGGGGEFSFPNIPKIKKKISPPFTLKNKIFSCMFKRTQFYF
jgi:hypothetical protein